MIDISKYQLVLIVQYFKNDYDINHNELHLLDIDDLENGKLSIYKILYNKTKILTVLDTDDEVKYDLCCLYGLKEMDKDLYIEFKDKFDKGILKYEE